MKDKAKKSARKVKDAGSVARVTEVMAQSPISFDAAVQLGIDRACQTLDNVTGAWVQDQKVDIADGVITNYRVTLKITFILND